MKRPAIPQINVQMIWPDHPRQEEQHHTEEDADDDARVTLSHEGTHCHTERYGG